MAKQTILVISDYHAPFNHSDAIRFLKAVKSKYKPTEIIQIGDEVDFHNLSFHSSDPDLPSAAFELEAAKEELRKLYKLFPKVRVLESNHGSMVFRKALEHGIPKAVFKSYNDILEAPKGWRWSPDYKVNSPLGLIYFCHGKSGAAGRLSQLYGCSTVQGHFHEKAGITYTSTPEKLIWDMHVGCLVDDKSLALAYNKINPKRPIISVAVIINGIPQIIPMILNKRGKWVGRL